MLKNNISALYIEDDKDISEEIAYFLEKKVSNLYVAADGEEGLKMFREFSPNVIITDIQMPKLNGLDMIQIIREENSKIPIIITSAFNESEKLLKAINLGVDGYLLKPINLAQLLQKIEKSVSPILLSKELKKSKMQLVSIEELEAKEKELLAYKERMDYAFTGSNDGLWDWNIEDDEIYLSARWKAIIGYSDSEIKNDTTSWKATIHPDDLFLAEEEFSMAFFQQKNLFEIELRQKHKSGHWVWVLARGVVKFDEAGQPIRMIGTHTDITKVKIIQDKLEQLSITDELTKLYNRRYFNKTIIKEINRRKRDKQNMAFLMLDVDSFKLYNDNYGHVEGDFVLAKIADVLIRFTSREGDYPFRLGGEEFGLIFYSDSIHSAKDYANKLIESIEELKIEHENNSCSNFVTASVGLILKKYNNDLSADEIYKIADEALYEAKASGRNQVKVSET